jgi:hypothetical protein
MKRYEAQEIMPVSPSLENLFTAIAKVGVVTIEEMYKIFPKPKSFRWRAAATANDISYIYKNTAINIATVPASSAIKFRVTN